MSTGLRIMSINSEFFIGGLKDFEVMIKVLQRLFNDVRFFGYRVSGDRVVFSELSSVDELPLKVSDVQRPSYYRLVPGFRFRHASVSVKNYLIPPEHTLLTVSQDYNILGYGDDLNGNVILLGIKPCDLKAINILDRIIYGKNPIYTKRRDVIKAIIVEECLEPSENCFCSVVNSGPIVESGFDIAYARLTEDIIIFKYGSSLGEKVLSRVGLKKADEVHIKKYLELVDRATSVMNSRVPNIKDIQKVLKERISDKGLWEELSLRCVGCGNCNYVCPTCFCIEIEDRVEGNYSKRVGIWTGCRTYTYGLVAGMHFRRELYTRYRHFILHKFLFYPLRVGDVGCVGCGRCSTWCPTGLDLKESLSRLTEVRS
jgi:ferredoxin